MRVKNIKWMTTNELENFIHHFANDVTKEAFLGVFPINILPIKIPHVPILFILNTNSANLPGQHWKAVYISKDRVGEVFDSLATPVSLQLQQWMNANALKWTHSKLTLQNPLSPSCGAYVLYFVMTRLKHNSLKSCLSPFTSNVMKNEEFVENFVRQFQ